MLEYYLLPCQRWSFLIIEYRPRSHGQTENEGSNQCTVAEYSEVRFV